MADTSPNAGPTSGSHLAACSTRTDPLARKMKLDTLKERIARAEYPVNPDVVAEALIRRVDVARVLTANPALSLRGAHSREPRVQPRPR
jgi:Anti-sigma-28 factor, FlgM